MVCEHLEVGGVVADLNLDLTVEGRFDAQRAPFFRRARFTPLGLAYVPQTAMEQIVQDFPLDGAGTPAWIVRAQNSDFAATWAAPTTQSPTEPMRKGNGRKARMTSSVVTIITACVLKRIGRNVPLGSSKYMTFTTRR